MVVLEAIANEIIRPATKIHLQCITSRVHTPYNLISLYAIIKMATSHTQAHSLVKDENPHYIDLIRNDVTLRFN